LKTKKNLIGLRKKLKMGMITLLLHIEREELAQSSKEVVEELVGQHGKVFHQMLHQIIKVPELF
jgi:hypothetical protein